MLLCGPFARASPPRSLTARTAPPPKQHTTRGTTIAKRSGTGSLCSTFDDRPQTVEVVRKLAVAIALAFQGFCRIALGCRGDHFFHPRCRNGERTVAVEHDEVARGDRRAAHLERHVELADVCLRGAARSYVPRPDRK